MLSLFPYLLSYEILAPFLLRVTLAVFFLHWAYRGKRPIERALHAVVGALLLIGLYTQLAALIATLIFAVRLVIKIKHKSFLSDGVNYYFILFMISLSLLFLGAGAFSFDLPL